jgi:predicted aspartyl protease
MNHLKLIGIFFLVTLLVWVGEVIYLAQQNAAAPDRVKAAENQRMDRAEIEYRKGIRALEQDYNKKKHLATGKTVFDRIYNTEGQSLDDLILHISDEALPESWSSDVKVEEFTHFILLIYLPHNSQRVEASQVISFLGPILEYCGWLLTDIAVFDNTHQSYLFFDKSILDEIKNNGQLPEYLLARAEKQGQLFTQFNSITIECEKQESHLFLLIEVAGSSGVVTCYALLDTGASTTTLTYEVISKTGSDNLQNAPRRNFNTANGTMSCPIVTREVNVGGFRKGIEVAVNQKDEMNLLGVNFFEGMDYIVDFQNSAIYVWGK